MFKIVYANTDTTGGMSMTRKTLHDPRNVNLNVIDPVLRLAVNEAGTLTFTIPPGHERYDSLTVLGKNLVEVLADNAPIFKGRVIKITTNLTGEKKIECEGVLASLNDTYVAPFDYSTSDTKIAVTKFFDNIIGLSSMATGQYKLNTGTVDFDGTEIYRSSESYAVSWDVLKEKLFESSLGGIVIPRYVPGSSEYVPSTVYIDYFPWPVDDIETAGYGKCSQSITIGENLVDMAEEIDASDLFTAVLPIGADGLTIEEMDNGSVSDDIYKAGLIIYLQSAEKKYGSITKIYEESASETVAGLKRAAVDYLQSNGGRYKVTRTISAIDLGLVDSNVQQFRVGYTVNMNFSKTGTTEIGLITALDLNLAEPENSSITIESNETGSDE